MHGSGNPEEDRHRSEASLLFAGPSTFLPRVLLMTGEYDTLTASIEKLKKKVVGGAKGQVLLAGRKELGMLWDKQTFKGGAKRFRKRAEACEMVVEWICNVAKGL